jgi:hypothetical protein
MVEVIADIVSLINQLSGLPSDNTDAGSTARATR